MRTDTINVGPDGDALVGRESSPEKKKSTSTNENKDSETTPATTATPVTSTADEPKEKEVGEATLTAGLHTHQNVEGKDEQALNGQNTSVTETWLDKEENIIAHDWSDLSGYESPESRDEEDGGVKLENEETDDEDAETREFSLN